MTKLNGTSGQLFSGLAESLNVRGTSRSGKNVGGKSPGDSSFNDLLHTIGTQFHRHADEEIIDSIFTLQVGGTWHNHLFIKQNRIHHL